MLRLVCDYVCVLLYFRASLACIILGSMIFFDDYSLVLIAGTSLRTVSLVEDYVMEPPEAHILCESIISWC